MNSGALCQRQLLFGSSGERLGRSLLLWVPMTPKTTKDRVHAVADQLPTDATLEDAIERLVFLAKIDRGLAEADSGKLVEHAEVERDFTR